MRACATAAAARHDLMEPRSRQLSLAAMLENNSVTHPQIGEWLESPTRDFHARLALLAFFPDGPGPASSPSYRSSSSRRPQSQSQRTDSSSMAPACIHQPSNASTHPPSLYYYSDATPTETSVDTGLAGHFSGVPLLEDVNGVLERPQTDIRRPAFECCFWFLNCSYISHDKEEWRVHCLSHFRGEEPPRSVQCPLCEDFKETYDNGWIAWNRRMEHLAYHHAALGDTLRTSRPDFHLFHHLWQKRLIDDQDLKELKGGNHNLTRTPPNFTVTNGRRGREGREGRGQRHQHIGLGRQRGLNVLSRRD